MKRIIPAIFYFMLLAGIASGQTHQVRFDHLGTQDGLPEGHVYSFF